MDETRYRAAERKLWSSVGGVVPVEHRLRLPTIGVDVRVQDLGEGEPILFVHGALNAGSSWAPLAAKLKSWRCLLIDRPGTGLSGPLPCKLTIPEIQSFSEQFVVDALDALGLERTHVVAASFGGYLALRAASHSSRVSDVIQLGCPAMAPGMRTPPFMRASVLPLLGRLIRRLPSSERTNRSVMRQLGHGASLERGSLPAAYLEWYLALQRHTQTVRHDGALIASAATLRGFDPRLELTPEVLGAIQAPTLFLWGASDGFGDPGVARQVLAAMHNAELRVLPECGHLPWLDQPSHVAGIIGQWLTARVSP